MGSISFLTGSSTGGQPSLAEALFQLENCSTVFLAAWLFTPKDLQRAGRVSAEAMRHLDHVVNEILRARDSLKAKHFYNPSQLRDQLNLPGGLMAYPVTRHQQTGLISSGPGNGSLPGVATPISLEKLLNKIKHRQHGASSNFRVNPDGRHIFLISVDKSNQAPDSIVEFDVIDFCTSCNAIAPLI